MAGQQFTIERSDLLRKFGQGQEVSITSADMVAEWLDERGDTLGAAEFEEIAFPPYEWPGENRSIKAEALEPVIMSRSHPPDDARSIRFRRGRRSAIFATEAAPAPWVTERTTRVFGGSQPRYEVRIFSEFFTDFDRFEAHVDEFYRALRKVDPFTRVDAAGKLRVIGHYATSPGAGGHFRTVPSGNASERRILGDQAYARQRLSHLLGTMPAMILIDSPVGGGAGGALANGRPHWPSWASIAPMNVGVPWILVAIHELAHAFGLSDEYIDSNIKDDRLPPRYENVSNAVRAADLPWDDLAGLPAATALPTHENDGTPINGAPTGPLAAFRGAYYRNHHWRPTRDCRMRNYRPDGFCAVCSRIILKHFAMQ